MGEDYCSDTELIEYIEKSLESGFMSIELKEKIEELIYRYTEIKETEGGLT